jgi:LAO/AO transport system kinase
MSHLHETLAAADLLDEAIRGSRRALADLLSAVERGGVAGRDTASIARARARGGYTIGLTGAPGAGKSTLTDGLIAQARLGGDKIAVLAVDPSSPVTGGAILGDRVRLADGHSRDDGVFVRSLANRGQLGGLARAVPDAICLLEASGWPWIVLETVGVGQAEIDVVEQADTIVVVLTPGWGDEIQANKAGLLEVADILVVNKSDRPGALGAVKDLKAMLRLSQERPWIPPIVSTRAVERRGLEELWIAVKAHRSHLNASGDLGARRSARRVAELRQCVADGLARATTVAERSQVGKELVAAVASGSADPVVAALELLEHVHATSWT